MSLFYPDVVIGRPGARCDALEAQNMIVCIPGARRCYQRAGRADLGCKIYVHNLRGCAKMDEMLRALLFAPHTSHLTPHTPHLTLPASYLSPITSRSMPHTYHLTLPASHLERHTSHSLPRASARQPVSPSARQPVSPSARQPVATNDCSGKYAVFSGTQSSGPWASMDLGPL